MLESHWGSYAQSWDGQSLPLRPCDDDLLNYQSAVGSAMARATYRRFMILGVTPELYRLGLSRGLKVCAMDRSESMIRSVWPGSPELAIQDDWQSIGRLVRDPSIIVCDGGLHLLDFEQQETLARCFQSQALKASTIILRLFLPVAPRQSSAAILDRFEQGEIPTVSLLKINLWHALDIQENDTTKVRDVWACVHQRSGGDALAYLTLHGQSESAARSFMVYQESSAMYYFQSLQSIQNLFSAHAGFTCERPRFPAYQHGSGFPVVSFFHD
jgi:hypothetical protein